MKYLVAKLFDRLCMIDELELKPTSEEYDNIQDGHYRLSRVDVNEHFYFPLPCSLVAGYVRQGALLI